MSNFQLGEQVWMINIEIEDDYFLLSKQTITELADDHVECEDDFNAFHVAYEDIFRSKSEAFDAMIERLTTLRNEMK